MSTEQKPKRGTRHTPGSQSARGGKFQTPVAKRDVIAAARAIYEGQPGMSCAAVAAQIGAPEGTVRRWKSDATAAGSPWKNARVTIQNLSGKAGELANSFKVKMSELGKPMDDAVAAREAEKAVSEEFAVDVRAQLLDRHRREWSAPRKIIYEAMQGGGDLDKAKLGKIAAETLMLIQTGECRAYGMDQAARGADQARTVVVIDRDGAEDVQQEQQPAALAHGVSVDRDGDDEGAF